MTPPPTSPLPADQHLTIIEPKAGWARLDLDELWRYRELLGFFVWRDIIVKYKQTLLGFAWAILVPFIQMIIFGGIFGKVAGLPTDGLPYHLYYFTNLVLWVFFATAFNRASTSLVTNSNLLAKIFFPRLIVPVSASLNGLIDFCIAFVLLLVMAALAGRWPGLAALLVPLPVLMALLTALAASLLLSALYVRYRDVGILVPFIAQIWMYGTVIIPYSTIQAKFGGWAWLYGLNPMAGAVETFRWLLFRQHMTGVTLHVELLAAGACTLALLFVVGLFYFRRVERVFADVI